MDPFVLIGALAFLWLTLKVVKEAMNARKD